MGMNCSSSYFNSVLNLIRNEPFCNLCGMLYLTFMCLSSLVMVSGFLLLPNDLSGETRVKNCNTDDFFLNVQHKFAYL